MTTQHYKPVVPTNKKFRKNRQMQKTIYQIFN